jgi:hypothetical protein
MKLSKVMAPGVAAIGAAALLGASACSSGSVRTVRGDNYGYAPHYLHYAGSHQPVPALIEGNAIAGMPEHAFVSRVIDEMDDRPLGGGPIRFQPTDPAALKGPLYVSLVFNPEPGFDSYDACDPRRASEGGGAPRADRAARLVAAFCSTERLLSGTAGETEVSGPDDPRLAQLIRVVMIDLFPLRDPNLGPSCDNCP